MFRKPELSSMTGLAWPATVSTLSFTLMEVLDCAMLGTVGVDAMGGAALASTFLCLAMAFPMNMLRAMAPVTATFVCPPGRQPTPAHLMRSLVHLTLLASLLFALLTTAISQAGAIALRFTGYDADMAAAAQTYLIWRSPFLLLDLLFVGGWALLEGFRDTRSPMIAGLLTNLANVLLNFLLIPRHGVKGAALATGLSTSLGLLLIAWAVVASVRTSSGRPGINRSSFGSSSGCDGTPGSGLGIAPRVTRTFLRTGWPMGIAGLCELSGVLILGMLVAGLGSVFAAVHGILIRLTSLGIATAGGLCVAVQVMVAQALGNRDKPAARRIVRLAFLLQGVSGTSVALCLLLGGRHLLTFFSEDPRVWEAGASLLPLCIAILWIEGILTVCGSVLEGAGRTRPLFAATLMFDLGTAVLLMAGSPMGMGPCYVLWFARALLKTLFLFTFIRDLSLAPRRPEGIQNRARWTPFFRTWPVELGARPGCRAPKPRCVFLLPYSLPLPDD